VGRDAEREPRARLFVALDVAAELRAKLADWAAGALADPAVRLLPRESLHVTLCFLGSVPERRIPEIEAVLDALEPRAVPLAPAPRLAAKPPSRPRFFALELSSQPATALQAELSAALSERGLYEPEQRPYWPHLTLAKVRGERGKRRPQRVGIEPPELPEGLVRTFDSVRVALYRSILRPTGAEYIPLATRDLPR
jgi:2'-5' RNA ligase